MRYNNIFRYAAIFLAAVMILGLLTGTACRKKPDISTISQAPAPAQLASTMVPNLPLDVYLYFRQERSTRVPMSVTGQSDVLNIDTISGWGVPGDGTLSFGLAITMSDAADASRLFPRITAGNDLWKMLSDRIIYLVYGTGSPAEALKQAIANNDFKNYDDEIGLVAVAGMPQGDFTKLSAILLAKPTVEVTNYLATVTRSNDMVVIGAGLAVAQLDVMAAGLYSSGQIDAEHLIKSVNTNTSDLLDKDIGLLVTAQSRLPAFLVEPAVSEYLKRYNFKEIKIGEITAYKLSQPVSNEDFTIMVRVIGSDVYAAISGKESYAQALISSIIQ